MHAPLSRRNFLGSLLVAHGLLRGRLDPVTSAPTTLDRVLLWRRTLDDASFEQATVTPAGEGVALSGTVLAAERGRPLRADYRLVVDPAWRSRSLNVVQEFDGRRRSLSLTATPGAGWLVNGVVAPQLHDCTDVDLGLSPVTNALPVNRLGLARGDAAEIVAAWVRFPDLSVVAARQRYERIGLSVYRYTSLASGFTAAIQVDDAGFPIDYEGVWKRIGAAPTIPGSVAHGDGFAGALIADGPSPELGDAASVFGFLVGGWSATVRDIDADGRERTGRGEWWFSWVLEGRAMQDVWISPPRHERGQPASPGAASNRYGTTVRRFDRSGGEWKIVWINPVSGAENHLRGGRDGDGITLVGEDSGTPIRWRFVDIRPDTFRWQGYRRVGDRDEWRLDAEFHLKRMTS